MTVRHHPDEAILASYAAGKLGAHETLIVAVHAAMCEVCRREIATWECAGGALLEEIDPVAMTPDALARTLARLQTQAEMPAAAVSNDNTPAPLRAFMGCDLSDVRWRGAGPGLEYATLARAGGRAVRLLRGAPNSNVGVHTHKGTEYTLALSGGYSDVTGTYQPGDFQTATAATHHNPTVDADGSCIILAVTTDYLTFDSLLQRIVGRILGF